MDEAPLEQTGHGLAPAAPGWFVVNAAEAEWGVNERLGAVCVFEAEGAPFPHLGVTLHVLEPGQANGLYHAERDQEDFLVLAGECVALVEGQERPLRAWDFLHCPPGTAHIFVGSGDGPCTILMVGGREHPGITYPHDPLAERHGASVTQETDSPDVAYAEHPDWRPGRPASFEQLPFA